jgi:hypothetical protein
VRCGGCRCCCGAGYAWDALAWTRPPVVLELTGPADGRWTFGAAAPRARVRIDATAYLRLLSGRPVDRSPDTDGDPVTAAEFLATRVEF